MNYLRSLIKVLNHPFNRQQKLLTLGRIGWWKINQCFFQLPAIVEIVPGMKIICRPDSSYGSYVVYAKFPEYEVLNFIQQYLKKGSIYIDVGADIGSEVLVAASKIKTGQIFAFEPDPRALEKLQENIDLNNLINKVTVIPKAVSDKDGWEQFVLESASEVSHLANNSLKNKKYQKTAAVKLDTFLIKQKIKKVDLIKIDVEGAEYKVLQGAKNSLRQNRIKTILFELNRHINDFDHSPKQVLSLLTKYNYKIYQFNNKKLERINIDNFKLTKTINLVAQLS